MRLVLASQSASRRAMLAAAGVDHVAMPAHIDEQAIKAAMLAQGASPRDIADKLAELKAMRVAASAPGDMIIGSDSVFVLQDGNLLDKPVDRADAAAHLRAMSGGRHQLISAVVIVEQGRPVWRHVDIAWLDVRPLSADFIEGYLAREWPAISGCVGAFRIEGPGVTLFDRIDGDHFTILGLPLVPLLAYLRTRGVLPS